MEELEIEVEEEEEGENTGKDKDVGMQERAADTGVIFKSNPARPYT